MGQQAKFGAKCKDKAMAIGDPANSKTEVMDKLNASWYHGDQ